MKTTRRALTKDELLDAERLKAIWDERSQRLKLTQRSVSKSFGFANQSAVSQYLNARIPLNLETAVKFAKILNTPLEDISPRHATSLFNRAESPTNMDQFGSGSTSGLVPEGCVIHQINSRPHPEIGRQRWLVVNPTVKIDNPGYYLLEADGTDVVVRVEKCEEGFSISGLSKTETKLPKEVAALLHIKGQILYKIFKV